MLKNCPLFLQHFSFGSSLETMKKKLSKWAQILRGFTKSEIKLILKVSYFYLEKRQNESIVGIHIWESCSPFWPIMYNNHYAFFLSFNVSTYCFFWIPWKLVLSRSNVPVCVLILVEVWPKALFRTDHFFPQTKLVWNHFRSRVCGCN